MHPDHPSRVDEFADFWAPDPAAATWREALSDLVSALPRRRGAGRTRAAALAVALGASLVALPQAPALALPREPEDMQTLRDRAEELGEEYNGELRDMEGVIQEAERATNRAEDTAEEAQASKEQVRALAYASYTGNGIDPAMSLFVDADPDQIIDRAVAIDYLATSNQDKIAELEQALERDEKAQEAAQTTLAEAEADLESLEERRGEVQEMIADHPNQPMGGQYNITPRTEQMRELVIEEFGEGRDVGGVGCYRAVGGWVVGEHPKGRACDFMVDGNGQMPGQEQIDRGWAIAEWGRENADRLGIMYIIYRQQIWDVRRGDTGWRAMADRGSITENHFDHVHISMF
ncbi:coiled-coil domain-containing protein [Nocardiopsis flavescens]|uniref:ARB-07466-like C-terminal domain-containing protein n=1 Tax=Nocardiopsis flavescens TaxID=758803 RepID=A0A1M6ELZ5_9ACTN|nr:hypothetical protein [Nocardiopsis flavescens]SHI86399.1 hypothetical protein SAMN05421803_102328 [Nocardiopsis flavescens]